MKVEEIYEKAKAEKVGMAGIREAVAKAEEETWIQHLGREDPLEEGGSQGQRSMAGYSPWVHKESHETKAT